MIRQVRLTEIATDASGNTNTRRVFAFGTHTLATTTDYPALGANMMTTAAVTSQEIRIVMDELLVGNYLEEIACRGPVDSDAYDRVPLGTTPDEVAKCSVAKDVLPGSCPGSDEHAVCICKIPGGCGDTMEGDPVGVLDVNQDGAADDTRFIAGAVGIKCGAIDVPLDFNLSYWNPSGDQNRPAMGGFDALGPAIVLKPGPLPGTTIAALPTNLECVFEFAPDIVDKQNNRVCAPVGGDVTKACTPGDVSAFKFKTQPLQISNTSFADGDINIDRSAPVVMVATAPVAMASLGAITVTQNGTPLPATAYSVALQLPNQPRLSWTTPLAATTQYVIHVATTLTDTFNQPLVMPATFTFTTGP